MSSKKPVVDILNEVADLLEVKGVQYKPRAYRRAAREIDSLTEDLSEIYDEGRLEEVPSVGKNIAAKVAEILETDQLEYHEDLKREIPIDPELLKVRNLGPKKARKIWEELGVTTIEELEEAGKTGKIRKLSGFGKKSEQNILKGLEIVKQSRGKSHISEVLPEVRKLEELLVGSGAFDRITFAGSLRRRKYEIGDLDILATADDVGRAMEKFTDLSNVEEVLSQGKTKSSIRTKSGLRVDLRIVDPPSYGSAMQYFTGSQEHNVRLRELAISEGYKLSEYGLFEGDTEKKVAGEAEEDVYDELGLSWIPPELREDRGEIGAAAEGELPELVEMEEVLGDLHCHSVRSSDASNPLSELAREAVERGYSYIAVTDHAETAGIVGGLTDDEVADHLEEIGRVNAEAEGVRLLAGVEANIQKDGSLDLSRKSLERLDIVIAGLHSHFDMKEEEMTERVIRAIENENVDILAHPTGRKLGERGSVELDWEEVFTCALRTGTALEINASPSRTDLEDKMIKRAVEKGVQLSIGTDSHRISHLDFMELGLCLARRGWCEKEDILNTLTLSELETRLGI